MIIEEIKKIIMDDVCIYEEKLDSECEYRDIFKGTLLDAPEELLKREIRCIGAKSKQVVDIQVR